MAKLNIKIQNNLNYSSDYFCIHSIQRLNSKFDTSVFTSNIPVAQLLKNRDILLVDDLRGDARWGMNKIIQRNISTKRVNEIRNEYLDSHNRAIKFFPAITVVLLPKTNGEPSKQYNSSEGFFDSISGIVVEKTYESENFIFDHPIELKWDKNGISALVIDGQHRVSAIRSFYEAKNESSYKDISIPVTFVIFKNSLDLDLIQATRALFIDVNNTPRLVSEEKLIFIDDRNIHRRITAQTLGANIPGIEEDDVYQKMLEEDDFMINNNDFINRYFLEESGKDDEENRGFLTNHNSLFPWELSNIMTIHRNILGNILLKYFDVDKMRDIRSICLLLNSTILDEINNSQSVEELDERKISHLMERLTNAGITDSELEIFTILIRIKAKNLEEIQQAQGEFFMGALASDDENQDRTDFINLLGNIYNQDCSKDAAFELSADTITNILNEKCSIFIKLLSSVYNRLWFTSQIKDSILNHEIDDRKLIFNFIINAHESLKVDSNIRRRTDKVEKQIKAFLSEAEEGVENRRRVLTEWAGNLENTQKNNLLRTVVGQEMLFLFLKEVGGKLNNINIDDSINFLNDLGMKKFFNSDYHLELKFFDTPSYDVPDFNQWSEITMKGDSMKPGLANATKGSQLIIVVRKNIFNRTVGTSYYRLLDKLQKSYGQEIFGRIANGDSNLIFQLYSIAKDYADLDNYLNSKDIETITEIFDSGDQLTPKVHSVLVKLLGGIALEQVVKHFYITENDSL
ncbi:hypothetical protein MVI27_08725 [Chryseobacterium salipaludis]|uniref:DNA sulfur modification protein DndB n=1 Tax=Chryseobacterium TaxID=59732 RepID=UPI001FF2AA5D|nr:MULTISPECIES: DNA sulfur modification protein DndB [Chryseobacterium]MCJ8498343.1 hypothetical protein [Chryseobacterium salipaludis]MCX3297411.1 hypothetical protein [Planobacterium sp. JC490]